MGAIAEPTIGRKTEYLPKIMSDFFFFEIECAKPFDTWCVYNGSVGGFRKEIHFGKSSSMHSLVVGIGYDAGSGDFLAKERVE